MDPSSTWSGLFSIGFLIKNKKLKIYYKLIKSLNLLWIWRILKINGNHFRKGIDNCKLLSK